MDGFQLEHHLFWVDIVPSHLWDCIYWPVTFGFISHGGVNGVPVKIVQYMFYHR